MNRAKVREAIEQARDLLATEMPWEEQIISGISQILDDDGFVTVKEQIPPDHVAIEVRGIFRCRFHSQSCELTWFNHNGEKVSVLLIDEDEWRELPRPPED